MQTSSRSGSRSSRRASVRLKFPIFLRLTCIILYIFTVILSNKLSSFEDSRTILSASVVDYISLNLGAAPISQLKWIKTTDSIPSGFEILPIYYWPGTRKGCLEYSASDPSSSSTTSQNYIIGGEEMTVSVYTSTCENIIERKEARTLYNWDNKHLVAKRNSDFYYKGNGEACKENYVSCTDVLCISKTESCPINKIEYSDDEDDVKLEGLLYNVEVSVVDTPCNAIGSAPYKDNQYPTLHIRNECGSYGQDTHIKVIDSQSETAFFKQNNLDELLNNLTGYPQAISNEKAYLVARERIKLKDTAECQVNIAPKSFLTTLVFLENREGILITVRIIETIVFALTFFVKYEEVFRLLEFYCFIELFLSFLMIPIGIYASNFRQVYAYSYLYQNDCFYDKNLHQALEDFELVVSLNAIMLVLMPITAILLTIFRLVVYRCARMSSLFTTNDNSNNQNNDLSSYQHSHIVPLLDGIYPTLINIGAPPVIPAPIQGPQTERPRENIEMSLLSTNSPPQRQIPPHSQP